MKPVRALLIVFLFASCGPEIYKSENLPKAVTQHKTVAILPAQVSIRLRPNQEKRMSNEQHDEMEKITGYDVQQRMYEWFLRRSERKGNFTVTFQDINTTNAKLKAANISYADLQNKEKKDIAKILGVDAVIDDILLTEKPYSKGAAITFAILLGEAAVTNQTTTEMHIFDGATGELLWEFDFEIGKGVGSSSQKLTDDMLRRAARKFPYQYSIYGYH